MIAQAGHLIHLAAEAIGYLSLACAAVGAAIVLHGAREHERRLAAMRAEHYRATEATRRAALR